MTEAHTFKLTTAENELGVVIACSEYGKSISRIMRYLSFVSSANHERFLGYPMKPISWTEMQCIKTNVIEYRKVAKIVRDKEEKD